MYKRMERVEIILEKQGQGYKLLKERTNNRDGANQ